MRPIDFDDTEIAFQSRSDLALRKAQLLFRSFNYPALVKAGPKLVGFALKLRLPVTPVIKATIFDQFCGGESIEDSEKTVRALARWKIGSILDYSVEAAQREEDFDRTTAEVLRVVERAAKGTDVPFAVYKVTGVGRFELLEKIASGQKLTAAEAAEEQRIAARVDRLAAAAHAGGVRMMIDAEETWIQDAVDGYALAMMRKYNRERAVIFNTAQMYRVDRLDYLRRLLEQGRREGFKVGVKLVRGAYMEKERERAKRLGEPSPIHPDKKASDDAFDAALRLCVDSLDVVAMCNGTHNERSTKLLTELMSQKGLAHDDARIDFAQLLGMSDNLTYNLAHGGYRASKYVPYGPVRAVLPYLFRRAEENSSIQGQAGRELQLIERELRRRQAKRKPAPAGTVRASAQGK